jgi:predicted metal-dependent hydrolase
LTEFTDSELGTITVQRLSRARRVSIRVLPNGRLRVVAPPLVPLFMIKRLVAESRHSLQKLHTKEKSDAMYTDGQLIGKSHWLTFQSSEGRTVSHRIYGQQLMITVPRTKDVSSPDVQEVIRDGVIAALRKQAKSYLPKRLAYLATQHGFRYTSVRFSHASSRWGSCSSNGTISLNIALMKLPFELIDYVLLHELSHTRHLNHSPEFWQLVEVSDPFYQQHRRTIKTYTPTI